MGAMIAGKVWCSSCRYREHELRHKTYGSLISTNCPKRLRVRARRSNGHCDFTP